MKRAEMQTAEQKPKQAKPRGGNPNWARGVSQNPRGRETKAEREARRDAIIAAWADPFGGVAVLRSAELTLLREAAELSMCKPRNSEDRVRHANTISKILAQVGFVGKRDRRRQAEPPSRFDHVRPLRRGLSQPREQRSFMMVVKNHMRKDEEIARFCAQHGVTEHDLLFVRTIVPFETRPGETAAEAYQRELRAMARNDDHGRKSQEALPDTA
jgi:hypothetical protein